MSAHRQQIVVVIGAVDPDTADEALRAAVGLTLRGARVTTVIADPATVFGPAAERARRTLAMFEHPVVDAAGLADALGQAHAVEVWGRVPASPPGPAHGWPDTVHLMRPGRVVPTLGVGDWMHHLPAELDDAHADNLIAHLVDFRTIVW